MARSRKQLKFFLPLIDRQVLRELPDRPGIYRMLDGEGIVIYVGKAVSLRQRVRSYFTRGQRHADHIFRMASKVRKIDHTVTGSVLEAALLESDEIKKISPMYNIALRDDDRPTWFLSSDLAEYGPHRSGIRTIGPVKTPAAFRVLTIIKNLINDAGACPPGDIEFLLRAIPGAYADYSAPFEKAWEEFYRHQILGQSATRSCLERLVQAGKSFWLRERRAEAENETGDCSGGAEPAEMADKLSPGTEITPEIVRRSIEARVACASWEIRRLRWYSLLSESSLAWTERINRKYKRRVIAIEKGRLTQCGDLYAEHPIPVPPGCGKRRVERQENLDWSTIDRMKVLTSEMKRIVSGKRWICLRLSPKVIMDRARIAATLRWI